MNTKRFLTALLALVMVLACIPAAMAEEKPETWIADRTIVMQAYVDDIYMNLPQNVDQLETPTMKKIKELTGIDLQVKFTMGDSDATTMASQLAAGRIPDVICCYLNNSTRPEFPIILKAAKEGVFADVSEYMANSKVYSKYMEEGYLPVDAYKNITFRDDLDGVYLMQLSIPAVDRSTEYIPEDEFVGGLYIQKAIADDLGIDSRAINTMDQFYQLLVDIKAKNYTDVNGNPIYPLGPKYWGGSVDSLQYMVTGYNLSPLGEDYGLNEEGKIVHEADTDFVYEKINFFRKLMAEGLVHPEYFTIDTTRAEELYKNKGVAIAGDCHNYVDIIRDTEDWIPLGPLFDRTGKNPEYVSGKGGYGAWAISAEAENPEEIFAFFDWLSTYEGQLIAQYGVEGLSYNMVDGVPVLTEEIQAKLDAGETEWLSDNVGAAFGGEANYLFNYMLTDVDPIERFGESRPGSRGGNKFAHAVEIAEQYPVEKVLVPGLDVSAYLASEEVQDVKASLDLLNYDEMLVQAMYAGSDDEVKAIVESFREQLKAAGIEKFYDYVNGIYAETPEMVRIVKAD